MCECIFEYVPVSMCVHDSHDCDYMCIYNCVLYEWKYENGFAIFYTIRRKEPFVGVLVSPKGE